MQTWQWLVLAVPAVVLVVSVVMIARILMSRSPAHADLSRHAEGPADERVHTDEQVHAEAAQPATESTEVEEASTDTPEPGVEAHDAGRSAFARPAEHAGDEPERALEGEPVVEGSGARPRNAAD